MPCVRKSMENTFISLGPAHSRKSYHLRTDSCYKLHSMLFGGNPHPNKRKNGVTLNRSIALKSTLSQALRFLHVVQRVTLEITIATIQKLSAMLFGILLTV